MLTVHIISCNLRTQYMLYKPRFKIFSIGHVTYTFRDSIWEYSWTLSETSPGIPSGIPFKISSCRNSFQDSLIDSFRDFSIGFSPGITPETHSEMFSKILPGIAPEFQLRLPSGIFFFRFVQVFSHNSFADSLRISSRNFSTDSFWNFSRDCSWKYSVFFNNFSRNLFGLPSEISSEFFYGLLPGFLQGSSMDSFQESFRGSFQSIFRNSSQDIS